MLHLGYTTGCICPPQVYHRVYMSTSGYTREAMLHLGYTREDTLHLGYTLGRHEAHSGSPLPTRFTVGQPFVRP